MKPAPLERELVAEVLARVAVHTGVDFRDYRLGALHEAIAGRLASLALGPARYLERLGEDPDEATRLAEVLLVPHTRFFREPAVFEALGARVIPALAATLGPGEPLRAWVVGTATGEEAWSLAMVLAETLGDPRTFEVLGTDVLHGALEQASRARYSKARVSEVSEARRARFFGAATGGEVELAAPLRERVRFARHNLVGPSLAPDDAVLASFHLICCRNVLIWFDARLLRKAVQRLAGALAPGGALVLGHAEALPPGLAGLGPAPALDPALRIYARKKDG